MYWSGRACQTCARCGWPATGAPTRAVACSRSACVWFTRVAGRVRLTALPPSVWKLRKLRVLDVRDNALAAIPAEGLAQLQLDELDTAGNPIHAGTRDRTAA